MFEDCSGDVFCFVSFLRARRDQRNAISFFSKAGVVLTKKVKIIIKTGVTSDTPNKPIENR